MERPDCYKCVHRGTVPGDAHSRCNNKDAKVKGDSYGIKMGWFLWPVNFDPTWLVSCDGFSDDPADKKPEVEHNPFLELAAILSKRL